MRWQLIPKMLWFGTLLTATATPQQPLLQLQGQPYFGGSMTLHVTAPGAVGQPVLLGFGLNPLPLSGPINTGKGPFYIGNLTSVIVLGAIPANGRFDFPFTMPAPIAGAEGIAISLQAYVASRLSNPATIVLDQPYYVPADAQILVSPNPTTAGLFGDRLETGDLNGDGAMDIVVGAWFEDAGGLDHSGRAHVFWGPNLLATTTLDPPSPIPFGLFGQGLSVADFNGDGIDDLVVSEGNGDPPPAGAAGHFYVYRGGAVFSSAPTLVKASVGTGDPYQEFGHRSVVQDLTNDGVPDIAVGLPISIVQGIQKAGRVEIYQGPDFTGGPVVVAPDLGTNGFFGDHLATGDVNGDSIMDLIVGAPRKPVGSLASMGRVYLFAGPDFVPLKTIEHPDPSGINSRFGNDVVARDLNGDSIDDVIATDQRNHAYVFWSPTFEAYTRITRPPDPVTGTAISTSFGYFAACGDVNGDGLADIVVADPYASGKGRAYAALAPYYSSLLLLFDQAPESGAEFGWGVRLRDLNGDGRLELLVGSDLADPGGVSGAGHVTIFSSNK